MFTEPLSTTYIHILSQRWSTSLPASSCMPRPPSPVFPPLSCKHTPHWSPARHTLQHKQTCIYPINNPVFTPTAQAISRDIAGLTVCLFSEVFHCHVCGIAMESFGRRGKNINSSPFTVRCVCQRAQCESMSPATMSGQLLYVLIVSVYSWSKEAIYTGNKVLMEQSWLKCSAQLW